MGKVLVVVALVAGFVCGVPLLVGLLFMTVGVPAVDLQLRAMACSFGSLTSVTAAPAAPEASGVNSLAAWASVGTGEGGVGFPLPLPGSPRYVSLVNGTLPIPSRVEALYRASSVRFNVPWTLLAGIGMEETQQGSNNRSSPHGARGIMQFLVSTWAEFGLDGDGDGRADITNDADSIFSAAHYLQFYGVTSGPAGVLKAIGMYNPHDWYANDVLFYAQAYGGGTVLGGLATCPHASGSVGDPSLPPMTPARVQQMFEWARARVGAPYRLGAEGPTAWDCSSYAQGTFASIGISIPRTAREQRDWAASGNGFRVQPGQEQPGDLVFTDTWLGTATVGHVMMVYDPATHTSLEEAGHGAAFYDYTRFAGHHIYEFWRIGNVADHPNP